MPIAQPVPCLPVCASTGLVSGSMARSGVQGALVIAPSASAPPPPPAPCPVPSIVFPRVVVMPAGTGTRARYGVVPPLRAAAGAAAGPAPAAAAAVGPGRVPGVGAGDGAVRAEESAAGAADTKPRAWRYISERLWRRGSGCSAAGGFVAEPWSRPRLSKCSLRQQQPWGPRASHNF